MCVVRVERRREKQGMASTGKTEKNLPGEEEKKMEQCGGARERECVMIARARGGGRRQPRPPAPDFIGDAIHA